MTQDEQSTALTKAEEQLSVVPNDMDMARALVGSKFFPNIQTASQARVKIQLGRELGFGPVAAMMGVHVWQDRHGRPSIQLSANLIANLVRRHPRYDFEVLEHDEKVCTLRFTRDGKAIGESRFTIEDAKRAGLAGKDVWTQYPKNMLYAAAMRNGAKWFCSEVMLGAAVPVAETEPEAGSVDMESGEVFEGEAVEIPVADIPVVSEPPEGYKPNWDAFWATAKELGLTREEVHEQWNVPADNGALKEYAERQAAAQDTTVTEIVALMTAQLRNTADRKTREAASPPKAAKSAVNANPGGGEPKKGKAKASAVSEPPQTESQPCEPDDDIPADYQQLPDDGDPGPSSDEAPPEKGGATPNNGGTPDKSGTPPLTYAQQVQAFQREHELSPTDICDLLGIESALEASPMAALTKAVKEHMERKDTLDPEVVYKDWLQRLQAAKAQPAMFGADAGEAARQKMHP